MRMSWSLLVLVPLALTSCATPPQVQKLSAEKTALSKELVASREQVAKLEARERELTDSIAEFDRMNTLLEKEKGARVEETADVRGETRSFVSRQLEDLSDFSRRKELFDYVGGELMDRSTLKGENLILIDLKNTMPSAGTLAGGRVFTKEKTGVQFCVLRQRGKDLAVAWVSQVYSVPRGGLFNFTFDMPVPVEKGDRVGLFSPGAVMIPFDVGTGDTRTVDGPPLPGQVIPAASFSEQTRRAYPFGVVGLLRRDIPAVD
jgi:hypothetical protein